jgi:hypothetical protein
MCPERLGAALVLLWLVGCAGAAEELREYTYPRDFEYVSRGEIRGAMGQLAVHVRRLDALLGDPPSGMPREPVALRGEVVRELAALEQAARALGSGDVRSNHPRLDEGADAFRERLAAARRAAERDPPSYYLAGTVSGACRYCHH